jgi:low temperature requirement protein LtrA
MKEPAAGFATAPDQKQQEWFEVFFDLVFAVAVSLWAERRAQEQSLGAYALSSLYLLPIWWVWLGQTVFATRFPAGAPSTQALSIVQVIGVGVMATQLPHEQPTSLSFALGFVAARLALLAMYARAARRSEEAKAVATVYLVGFGTGAAIWAISAALPAASRPFAWAFGLAVDFTTPWVRRPTLARVPLDHHHLYERVGLFNSLLLYVAIEGIVRGLAGKEWSASAVIGAILSFSLVVSLWWIYAARVNRPGMRTPLGSPQSYLYSQFLVVLGVGTSSIGIRALGEEATARTAITLLAGGVLLWIGGLVLIRAVVMRHRDRYWQVPFLAALVVIPLLAIAGPAQPLIVLALLDGIVLALLAIEVRHGAEHTGPTHRL